MRCALELRLPVPAWVAVCAGVGCVVHALIGALGPAPTVGACCRRLIFDGWTNEAEASGVNRTRVYVAVPPVVRYDARVRKALAV
jgi:hypothetical protein